tara:strand:+ start:340 stop:474 length:135 start_codon:yes stop_codon:yes gene_type:complete
MLSSTTRNNWGSEFYNGHSDFLDKDAAKKADEQRKEREDLWEKM